jgi:ChrR-like protein with cupin domain
MIARHRHSGAVHAWVFKGRWHYLEHWVAEEGSYIFEPPGIPVLEVYDSQRHCGAMPKPYPSKPLPKSSAANRPPTPPVVSKPKKGSGKK